MQTPRPPAIPANLSPPTPSSLTPPTVILADGQYPTHPIPLHALTTAGTVVCCDGAAVKLWAHGRAPDHIVGDLDSLPGDLQRRFADRLHHITSQETNDLTKAVGFCTQHHVAQLTIVGATGLREDHTIANISLLADYAAQCDIEMLTDYGTFTVVRQTATLASYAGQPVSLFSLTPAVPLSSDGLRYPLHGQPLHSWWKGSLNEAAGNAFTLRFDSGVFIIFRGHRSIRK
ncbi:MAG: thiamine diphosphokinase [Prevotellaceae bacterium]|jgi:thiamine pyrophosphokinase|nr:thiamine diphosphokinase [Prevotellaceae bacterium]